MSTSPQRVSRICPLRILGVALLWSMAACPLAACGRANASTPAADDSSAHASSLLPPNVFYSYEMPVGEKPSDLAPDHSARGWERQTCSPDSARSWRSESRRRFVSSPHIVRRSHGPTPLGVLVVILSTASFFVLMIALTRSAKNARASLATPARPASGIVALSCSRCARVVDLPRSRASRIVFCPRCGATMRQET